MALIPAPASTTPLAPPLPSPVDGTVGAASEPAPDPCPLPRLIRGMLIFPIFGICCCRHRTAPHRIAPSGQGQIHTSSKRGRTTGAVAKEEGGGGGQKSHASNIININSVLTGRGEEGIDRSIAATQNKMVAEEDLRGEGERRGSTRTRTIMPPTINRFLRKIYGGRRYYFFVYMARYQHDKDINIHDKIPT